MSTTGIVINLALFFLYGIIFAVLSMIPAVQKFAWASRGKRILVIVLNALLVIVVSFLLMTSRNVRNDLQFAQNPQLGIQAAVQANQPALVRELWLRETLPGYIPGAPRCFSNNAPWTPVPAATADPATGEEPLFPAPTSVCELADQVGVIAQQDYIYYWGFYLLAGVVCAAASWYFTRPKPQTPTTEEHHSPSQIP